MPNGEKLWEVTVDHRISGIAVYRFSTDGEELTEKMVLETFDDDLNPEEEEINISEYEEPEIYHVTSKKENDTDEN